MTYKKVVFFLFFGVRGHRRPRVVPRTPIENYMKMVSQILFLWCFKKDLSQTRGENLRWVPAGFLLGASWELPGYLDASWFLPLLRWALVASAGRREHLQSDFFDYLVLEHHCQNDCIILWKIESKWLHENVKYDKKSQNWSEKTDV